MKPSDLQNSNSRFTHGCSGQGLAEYLIMVVVVAIVVLVAVRLFGKSVNCQFQQASGEIDEASRVEAGCLPEEEPVSVPVPVPPAVAPPAPAPPGPPPPAPAPPPPPPPPPPPTPQAEPSPIFTEPLPMDLPDPTPEPTPVPTPVPTPEPTPKAPPPTPTATPSPTPTPEELEEFANPQFGGAPLDACLHYGVQCGKEAADAFCKSQGFTDSKSFVKGAPVTKTGIPDGTYCDFSLPPTRAVCQVFAQVTCRK